MKAVAVFPRTREAKVIEHAVPRITVRDQVKVHMLDIRIFGTDREICNFEYGAPPMAATTW
jgi:glucose 1-dehydrogenase